MSEEDPGALTRLQNANFYPFEIDAVADFVTLVKAVIEHK